MKDKFLAIDWAVLSKEAMLFWDGLGSRTVSTLTVILVGMIIRWVIITWLEKDNTMSSTTLVQWRHRIRNSTFILIAVLLLIIWAPQLRTFAVSVVAVAMAFVIALKELISCITGSVIRASVDGSTIGGRITIKGIHGDVVANNILSTTLLEVNSYGQRTGRTVVIPNSLFLTESALTETVEENEFVLLNVPIPLSKETHWLTLQEKMLAIGTTISEPYMRDAQKRFAKFKRKFGFNTPGPEPKVQIEWPEADKITLNLRLAVPAAQENRIRQEILRGILHEIHPVAVPNTLS
jgi:small-conductance mechanosensitive channel